MALDIYSSRRSNFIHCKYWHRDISHRGDNAKLVYETSPAGFFYARIISDKAKSDINLANAWHIGVNDITLETTDIIDIETHDLVKFNNHIWIVERVAETPVNKNFEFSQNTSKKTVINIKKGE